jgi:hypothetical protein
LKKLLLLCLISFSSQFISKPDYHYSNLVKKADLLSYDFKFDSSKVLLDKAIKYNSLRPEAYLIKAKIHLWYFLGSKDSSDYNLFRKYSDSVITKTDALIRENYQQPDLLYLTGNVYKFRAMAFGSKGNTLDAFWSTKNAVAMFEDVIEIDSNFYAAYGGIGIFEYALSYVPALFNWALALSGLNADQNNGFRFIELAAKKAKIDKVEYQFHLAKLLDEHLAEYQRSLNVLKELLYIFPNNQLIQYQAAIESMKLRKLDNAVKYLQKVQKINHPKFIQTSSFSNFLLGDIYFRKKEYNRAIDYYKAFLTSTKTIDYTGIASLRTAYCYHFLDQENESRKYLLLASNGNLDLEDDSYAHNVALEIIESGFPEALERLIDIENDYLAGNSDSVIVKYLEFKDSVKIDRISAQIYNYAASVFLEKGRTGKAKEVISAIENKDQESIGWVLPMKFYYLAKISYIENNYILANKYLDLAHENNDYHKQAEIKSYINGLRKKITDNYEKIKTVRSKN